MGVMPDSWIRERALRDGMIDLETGGRRRAKGQEVRAQALFRDRFVGVVLVALAVLGEPLLGGFLAHGIRVKAIF